jgi:26S proteasome regulatory subunit N9
LWHQLTDKLFAFSHEPTSAPYRVDVFENFVLDFESRMNPLRLVELAVIASKEIDSQCIIPPPTSRR